MYIQPPTDMEEDKEMVRIALSMSLLSREGEYVPCPGLDSFSLDEDLDEATGTSLQEDFMQLAACFLQMMQLGNLEGTRVDGDEVSDESDGNYLEDTCPSNEKDEEVHFEELDDGVKGLKSGNTKAATKLHRAVFDGDMKMVKSLLESVRADCGFKVDPYSSKAHPLDTQDHFENTPLMLAVKLGYTKIAELLIHEGFSCDVFSSRYPIRSDDSNCVLVKKGPEFHLIDECVLVRDTSLLIEAQRSLQKASYGLWLQKKELVLETLLKIPDFYVELNWEFQGGGPMGPLVKMFAPYDTYRIWKKGNWLRLDSTIDGIHPNNFKIERAHKSFVFKGSDTKECTSSEGELFVLNRNDKSVESAMRKLAHPTENELNHFAHHMIRMNSGKNNIMRVNSMEMDASNWSIFPLTDRKSNVKTLRLSNKDARDVYASCQVENYENDADKASNMESRLCYKWKATGEIKAVVDSKTSADRAIFRSLSADEYFNASECQSNAEGSSSSKWSERLKINKFTHKDNKRPGKSMEMKRSISAALYMIKDYPISLSELLPVLDIFAMKNDILKKLVSIFKGSAEHDIVGDDQSFLSIPPDLFPYRIHVPIILGISAVVTFGSFKRDPDIDSSLFSTNLNANFQQSNADV